MAHVVPLPMRRATALKLVRELVRDTDNIVLLPHARKRMKKRSINNRQIEICLRLGIIREGPFMNQHGNWQVTMERLAAGEEMKLAVAIEEETKLLIITVM